MKAIPALVALAATTAFTILSPAIPDAQAMAPEIGGPPESNIAANLVCEIEATQVVITGFDHWGLPVFETIELEDEDYIGWGPLTIKMMVHNYGPADADDLVTAFTIAASRTVDLFDLTDTDDVVDGDAWTETVVYAPGDLDGYSRLNVTVEADLEDQFGVPVGPLPPSALEWCSMQLNLD